MRSRIRWVRSLAVIALAIGATAGWTFRHYVAESWYLYRLDSSDRSVREKAALELGQLRSRRAVAPLVVLLAEERSSHASDAERPPASPWREALVAIGSRGILELLEEYRAADDATRAEIDALAVGIEPRTEDAPALVAALGRTAESSYREGTQSAPAKMATFRDMLSGLLVELEGSAPYVAGEVEALTRSPDPGVRRSAVLVLRAILEAPGEHLPRLLALLRDEDAGVRTEAAFTLGHFGPKLLGERSATPRVGDDESPVDSTRADVTSELERLRGDSSTEVALTAKWALGRIRSEMNGARRSK